MSTTPTPVTFTCPTLGPQKTIPVGVSYSNIIFAFLYLAASAYGFKTWGFLDFNAYLHFVTAILLFINFGYAQKVIGV